MRQDQTNTLTRTIRETLSVTKAVLREGDCTCLALFHFLAACTIGKTTITISGIKARQIPIPGPAEDQLHVMDHMRVFV